ncbi:hypothetical protein D3C72_1837100 [compost metagenome]
MSYCPKAKYAAVVAVMVPMIAIVKRTVSLNKGNKVLIKNTPAATMVAACIKDETDVGPSIASGNQTCNGNWADFAIAPKKNARPVIVNQIASILLCGDIHRPFSILVLAISPSFPNRSTRLRDPN